MIELWESSVLLRIIINTIGAISIVVGVWILIRVFKSLSNRFRNNKALSTPFVKIMSLPPVIKGHRQIGCVLKEPQQVVLELLDENEKNVLSIFNGKLDEGEKLFKVDFNKIKNGNYYLSVSTDKQDILRKITVKN